MKVYVNVNLYYISEYVCTKRVYVLWDHPKHTCTHVHMYIRTPAFMNVHTCNI